MWPWSWQAMSGHVPLEHPQHVLALLGRAVREAERRGARAVARREHRQHVPSDHGDHVHDLRRRAGGAQVCDTAVRAALRCRLPPTRLLRRRVLQVLQEEALRDGQREQALVRLLGERLEHGQEDAAPLLGVRREMVPREREGAGCCAGLRASPPAALGAAAAQQQPALKYTYSAPYSSWNASQHCAVDQPCENPAWEWERAARAMRGGAAHAERASR